MKPSLSLLLLLSLCTCQLDRPAPPHPYQGQTIGWSDNYAGYFAWSEEEQPTLLLGADFPPNFYLLEDRYYESKLDELVAAGGNFVRCDLNYAGSPSNAQKRDVDGAVAGTPVFYPPNADIQLDTFVRACDQRGIVVNVNLVLSDSNSIIDSLDTKYRPIFLSRVASLTADRGNVITTTEHSGFDPVADIPADSRGNAIRNNLSTTEFNYRDPDAWIRNYNTSLLQGAGAVLFTPPEDWRTAPSGPALTNIRTIRNLARQTDFWNLTIDQSLIDAGASTIPAVAARDEAGNYLVHMTGAGAVALKLPAGTNSSYDVSVIGYLGTKRTERLDPPYDNSFTIRSNEDRGGWLLLKRVE